MNDPLRDYLKKHQPTVPAAPADEWERVLARTKHAGRKRQQRAWLYASALTLSAAGLLAFVNLKPHPQEPEAWLEPEDLVYLERVEDPDGGVYQDWLWLAEHVAADPGE